MVTRRTVVELATLADFVPKRDYSPWSSKSTDEIIADLEAAIDDVIEQCVRWAPLGVQLHDRLAAELQRPSLGGMTRERFEAHLARHDQSDGRLIVHDAEFMRGASKAHTIDIDGWLFYGLMPEPEIECSVCSDTGVDFDVNGRPYRCACTPGPKHFER